MSVTETPKALTKKEKKEQRRSEMQEMQAEALLLLENLGGKAFRDDDVVFAGDKLVLPENMNVSDAIKFLQRVLKEESETTEFSRTFHYRPWDVAYCSFVALKKVFGAINHTHGQVMTFFGPQDTPPQMITINTGPHTIENVPWGGFKVPFLPNVQFYMEQQNTMDRGPLGRIRAEGAKKWQHAVEGVFRIIEQELRDNSIYKGKAFDAQQIPQFLDLSTVDPDKIVYSQDIISRLEADVWSPMIYKQATEKLGIPFKRAILLTGDFGVGKTLAINRTGQIAEQQEITFVLVRPGRDDLQQAMTTARMYQPAIVAFEDVDIIADADQEDRSISQILDMFDGIEAKNSQVMLLLTSNHIEKLHKGMLRPGRLDAVIKITPPDADGIRRLIEVNVPDNMLEDYIEWEHVCHAMNEYLPAFIVEATQRSLRYNLVRNGGVIGGKINTQDLVLAGEGLREQFDLMQDAKVQVHQNGLDRAMLDLFHRSIIEKEDLIPEPGETPLGTVRRYFG